MSKCCNYSDMSGKILVSSIEKLFAYMRSLLSTRGGSKGKIDHIKGNKRLSGETFRRSKAEAGVITT